jgi:hypothetical protein
LLPVFSAITMSHAGLFSVSLSLNPCFLFGITGPKLWTATNKVSYLPNCAGWLVDSVFSCSWLLWRILSVWRPVWSSRRVFLAILEGFRFYHLTGQTVSCVFYHLCQPLVLIEMK